MQHTASLVQIAASRRSPTLVAGVGAAFMASAITLSVMMSGAVPATAPQQAADGSKHQCQVVQRARSRTRPTWPFCPAESPSR